MPSETRITTGQFSWDGGVNSGVAPTIAGPLNPQGLKPNQTAWCNNCSLRAGGISPRGGWEYLATMPAAGLFNSSYMYEPPGEFPYIVLSCGGRIFRICVDTDNSIDEITQGNPNPDVDLGYMVQGERFLVIQAGDYVTNPLFWDGATMRRSAGIQRTLGVVSIAGVVPAVGSTVLLDLSAPFEGQSGDLVFIDGATFVAVAAADFVVLRNDTAGNVGGTVAAGTIIGRGGTVITTTQAPFVIPPPGGNTAQIPISPTWGSPIPLGVHVGSTGPAPFEWTAMSSGAAAIGANQVYLVNVTGTPNDPIAPGALLLSAAELPPAGPMDYYMGRIWEASGRQYLAGDIVRGPSGTAAYNLEDSILKITENSYLTAGGVFTVPTMAGNIRALKHPANLDSVLGEGALLPMTRRNIYSVHVVPTRAEWIALSEPLQRVAQINFGTVSDRSVVSVNSDLYYQSVDGVRSHKMAIRNFDAGPGNVPESNEVQRAVALNNRALLRFGTGIEFDNRLLQSCLPFQTPVGVAHAGLLALNFDLQSAIGEKLPPAWEGVWEGVNVLQLLKGDFGGRQRAFAFVWSSIHNAIELWELTADAAQDRGLEGEDRIRWSFETPSFNWGDSFQLKQLDTMELWVDRLIGTVEFTVEFRPGQYPCWQFWHHWEECASRNTCELPNPLLPCDYPEQPYLPQYRIPMVLPTPPKNCNDNVTRPMDIDGQFQFRITIKGNCRIRGIIVHALPRERAPYEGLRCTDPGPLADVPKRIL